MSQYQTDIPAAEFVHHAREPARQEETKPAARATVVGPSGMPLSLRDLPPPGTQRWVVRRKAEVVAGVRGGLISLNEALKRYNLTIDEFRSWQRLLDSHGLDGLRTTQLKKYRQSKA